MYDITVYLAVIIAIVIRVYLMKGKFILPTFYKTGNEVSFNLGSVSSIIVGVVAAVVLFGTNPSLLASNSTLPSWFIAGLTAYSAPQILDAIVTKGTRIKYNNAETSEDIESIDEVFEDEEEL